MKVAKIIGDLGVALSEEEFNKAVKNKLEELEPYWTKVIAIYADN